MLCALLFSTSIKAQQEAEQYSDSLPSFFLKLKSYYNQPDLFLPYWDKVKKEIETEKGNKTLDLYYLYKTKAWFHYKEGDLDSLKQYTPIIKDLCLQLHNYTEYYRNWSLLCENIIYSSAPEDDMKEVDNMYNDALERKSDIGLAFSLAAIANYYGANKDYTKAQPYLTQAMQLFKDLKCWDEYTTLSANYIIILLNTNRKEESKAVFYHLDSLANVFIRDGEKSIEIERILMIKDMASEVFREPKDTVTLKKYLSEMEEIYQNKPNAIRIYLYNSKEKYASLKKDRTAMLAYQALEMQYYKDIRNMTNLKRIYNNMASALAESEQYEEAYRTLRKYISLSDSLYREDSQKRLNELSARYNMNKLELEAQKMSLRARNIQFIYACSLLLVLAVTLIIGIKFYMHKLRNNRLLQQQAQELIKANEKAQQAQLMKTAFIQNMNHEVRTPLNSIVGFSECLAEVPMNPEEGKEISITIRKNSNKLLKIISDILSIANMDSGENMLTEQQISIDNLCSGLIREMQEHVQPGVNLHYTPNKSDYILVSNEHTVHQVLYNLLHNALKFTQSGEVEISYRIDKDKNELGFYVRDTGPGIQSELKEKVFERFYKVDSFMPGAGLGLALCKILAERVKARVYLDDSYQKGSLFVFMHPLK